jgi:hypothetical protein
LDPAKEFAFRQERKIPYHLLCIGLGLSNWLSPGEKSSQSIHGRRYGGGTPFSTFPLVTSHFERFKSQFEDLEGGYLQKLQINNEPLLSLLPFILTGGPARNPALNLSP